MNIDKKKVIRKSETGDEVLFISLGKAAESVNGFKQNISSICNGTTKSKKYKGFYWRWA